MKSPTADISKMSTRDDILDEAVRRKTNAFDRARINSLALPSKAAKFIIADIVMEFHKLSKSVGRDSEEADSGRSVTSRPVFS